MEAKHHGLGQSLLFARSLRLGAAVLAILFLLLSALPAWAAASKGPIGPSTSLDWRQVQYNGRSQRIGLVRADLTDPLLTIRAARAPRIGDRERVSSQALRDTRSQHAVIAAINADFFDNTPGFAGVPIGMFVSDGELLVNPFGPSLGFLENGRALLNRVPWRGRVQILNSDGEVVGERSISGVNRRRGENRLILYTPAFGSNTRTNGWGVEVAVTGQDMPLTLGYDSYGTVHAIEIGDGLGIGLGNGGNGQDGSDQPEPDEPTESDKGPDDDSGASGNTDGRQNDRGGGSGGGSGAPRGAVTGVGSAAIPSNGMVLSGHGEAGRFLLEHMRLGRQVRIVVDADGDWAQVRHAVGGQPILVAEGKAQTIPADAPAPNSRAPRTAAGLDYDGRFVFVTVDGRQSGSAGFTLPEFANYLVEQGLRWAVNLDGGGSTTLFARPPGRMTGRVINRPSDGSERAVANSLQIVSLAPAGSRVNRLWVEPQGPLRLLPGAQVSLQARAQDEYFNPVDIEAWSADWTLTSGSNVVSLSDSGRLKALLPGTARAEVTIKDQTSPVEVTVLGPEDLAPVELNPGPGQANWQPESTVTLGVRLVDKQGRSVQYNEDNLRWRASRGLGRVDGHSLTLAQDPAGELSLSLRLPGGQTELSLGKWHLTWQADEEKWQVESAPAFPDVVGHWAADAINELVGRGVVQGYPEGVFLPDQYVTRAELVRMTIGALLAGGHITSEDIAAASPLTFTDEKAIPDWVADQVALALDLGLVTGYEDGTFQAQQKVNREQAVTISFRTYALVENDAHGDTGGNLEEARVVTEALFEDEGEIAPWAITSVAAAVEAGLVYGFDDHTFRPLDVLTRAQAVTLLLRIMGW